MINSKAWRIIGDILASRVAKTSFQQRSKKKAISEKSRISQIIKIKSKNKHIFNGNFCECEQKGVILRSSALFLIGTHLDAI